MAARHLQVNCLDQPMISEPDMSLPLDAAVRQRIADPALSKSAQSDDRKPKYAGRASFRGSVSAMTISAAAGILLALASAGHAQSRINALLPGVPPGHRLAVDRELIPGPDARQAATMDRPYPDNRQSRDWDGESQRFYDEIMRRVDVPLTHQSAS